MIVAAHIHLNADGDLNTPVFNKEIVLHKFELGVSTLL